MLHKLITQDTPSESRSSIQLLAMAGERGDLEKARKLVNLYGSDTLAYFALREDKRFFFASNGRSMIAYAVYGRTALASGDPIGDPNSAARVIDEFIEMCRQRKLRVAFLAAREDKLALYERAGLRTFYIGDEAILDCENFKLSGSKMRPVRLPVNKLTKRGFSFELIDESEASPAVLHEVDEVSTAQHSVEDEAGFTMGLSTRVTGSRDNRGLLLAIARNPEGQIEGFLRFAPCTGRDPGYSLDLMRRAPGASNGVMEFLIASTALGMQERGVKRLSLNFSAVRRYFQKDAELGRTERAVRWLLVHSEWLLPIRSLVSWNKKFRPNWSSLYILHQPGGLPRAGLLYIVAEGFVKLPFVGRLRMPQVRELEGSVR